MLRLCVGLALAGLVATAEAAEWSVDFVAPKPDPSTTRFVNSDTVLLPAYQRDTDGAPTSTSGAAPMKSGFSNASPALPAAESQQENAWRPAYDGNSISLRRLSRVEFKVAQANIVLRLHSVSIDEERFKVTFNAHSALIEKGGVTIMLQPHVASILWSKAF